MHTFEVSHTDSTFKSVKGDQVCLKQRKYVWRIEVWTLLQCKKKKREKKNKPEHELSLVASLFIMFWLVCTSLSRVQACCLATFKSSLARYVMCSMCCMCVCACLRALHKITYVLPVGKASCSQACCAFLHFTDYGCAWKWQVHTTGAYSLSLLSLSPHTHVHTHTQLTLR